jgi:hypothetical protein
MFFTRIVCALSSWPTEHCQQYVRFLIVRRVYVPFYLQLDYAFPFFFSVQFYFFNFFFSSSYHLLSLLYFFLFPIFSLFYFLLHTWFFFLLSLLFIIFIFSTFLYTSTLPFSFLSIHLKTAVYASSAAASVES